MPSVPEIFIFANVGLVETIKLAAGAVAKTGDQMTGNLRIKDAGIIIETEEYDSPNIIISNTKTGADLNIDLLNDNIRIFGKASGSSVVAMLEFNLTNGILTASGGIATPESSFNKEGDVWGGKWGGWLSS